MKKVLLLLALVASSSAWAQMVSPTAGQPASAQRLQRAQSTEDDHLPFDEALAPFYHGVASGDPLSDAVVIWTRVTSETDEDPVEVTWAVYADPELTSLVAYGDTTTTGERDFTVKVDVPGLEPATTYYYAFAYNGQNSLTGRTRTAPAADEADQLRFAVVSCSNYQAGYFNAYGRIAERQDLDAVIHLGDYIYEYGAGAGTYGYDSTRDDRSNVPDTEILTVADYRTRYSLYRLDPDLRAAHQQHPFIPIWDDHESANDAYKDGAENHNEDEDVDEGDWETRKELSKEVWFEWMPVRETADRSIYRTIEYGNLADLIMVDTRLEGREEQPLIAVDTVEYRTVLGETQKAWLFDELNGSDAQWKIIGNQIIFSQLNVGFAATDLDGNPAPTDSTFIMFTESIFVDIWDGYPKERRDIINEISENDIDNVVILTGDFHSTFAFDVTNTPVVYPNPAFNFLPTPSSSYDPATGLGSVAVEFATPSITSANFDENIDAVTSAVFEVAFNSPQEALGGVNYNPHMKNVDLDRHGYFVLDITETAVQADWFYVDILDAADDTEEQDGSYASAAGTNHLTAASSAATEKTEQPELAPTAINAAVVLSTDEPRNFTVFSAYPNPAREGGVLYMNLAFVRGAEVSVDLLTLEGKSLGHLLDRDFGVGNYTLTLDLPTLTPGVYLLQVASENEGTWTKKLVIR
ncbi:MAG TPA: phosphodiesterase [Cytophagales bacterium]|nr:phosphodiesterase [Cytophagales bacterium]